MKLMDRRSVEIDQWQEMDYGAVLVRSAVVKSL